MQQGTLLSTATFSELADLIRKEFVKVQQMVQPQAYQLFIKDPIAEGNGSTKRYDEIDTQTFARKKFEGQNSKKAKYGIGYNVTMTKKRIALEIDVTYEMRKENRYPQVSALITNLTHFCPQRLELDLTHRLTFSNATSYVDMDGDTVDLTLGDGLALVSTAHTLAFSASTYSNNVTGNPPFSRGGIEGAELLATNSILSNFGERRVMMFNTIVTGDDPNTCNNVKQFLNSTADVDQNNAGVINPYKGKYRHIMLPWLASTATGAYDGSKKRWWFLISIDGVNGWQAYLGMWEEPHMKDSPADGKSNDNYSADIWTWGTRAGYGIQAVSPRGFIASQPTN